MLGFAHNPLTRRPIVNCQIYITHEPLYRVDCTGSMVHGSLHMIDHQWLALQYLATVRDHNTLLVLAHLPATEVVYFAITHLAGNRHRVNTGCLGREVTRGGIRHLNTSFVGIKLRARSFQLGAEAKHIAVIFYLAALTPIIVAVDRGQGSAAIKHAAHIGNICRIEVGQVERYQGTAAIEHAVHIGNIYCIEVGQVERFQGAASIKHAHHGGNVCCIEVSEVERH